MLIASRLRRRRFVTGRRAARRRGGLRWLWSDVPGVFDDGAYHRQQRHAVLGDDSQKRMLFTGRQRGKRTHRAPHLLTLARGVAAARRASCGQSHRRVEPVEDGLGQMPQFGTDLGMRP